MERKRISVSLSDTLANRMEEKIETSGLSASEIIRAALNEYLNKGEVEHG